MSLNSRLLELLSTPAARAASDIDTRRAVARLLACDGSLGLPPETSADLLGQRLAEALGEAMDLCVVNATTIEPVRVSAMATVLTAAISLTTTCQHCGDFESGVWRRRVELDLGDGVEVRGATHTRLRRMLSIAIQELGADLATAQRERDSARHTIEVMAQLAAEGNIDEIRMHFEHATGPAPDLNCEEVTHG